MVSEDHSGVKRGYSMAGLRPVYVPFKIKYSTCVLTQFEDIEVDDGLTVVIGFQRDLYRSSKKVAAGSK